MTASDEERVKGAVGLVQLLRRLGDLTLRRAPPRPTRPSRPARAPCSQVLLDVLLDGDPAVVDVDAGAEN